MLYFRWNANGQRTVAIAVAAPEARMRIRRNHNMHRTASIIAGIVFLLSLGATAQETRSEISLQGTGFFTKDTTGQRTTQRSTDSGGFLVGYRYTSIAGWRPKESTAMGETHSSTSARRDCPEFKPTFTRRPADLF